MTVTTAGRTLTMCVVICVYTCDRWDDILAAVASVRSQRTAPEEIVVVVDHNPDLYGRLRAVLPDVTVVENRKQRGLSGGKNTGVEVTSSDVVAFWTTTLWPTPTGLDTFARLHRREHRRCRRHHPPLWESARPRWFPEELDWVLGCTFTGREPGPVRNLLGGNASFRREVFSVAGGFPSHIGRTSAQRRPLGCEETEFCIRVSQHRPDWTFVFEPQAVIWHRVPAERERFSYFRSRCFAEGIVKGGRDAKRGRPDGFLGRAQVHQSHPHARCGAGARQGTARRSRRNRALLRHLCRVARRAAGYARAGVSLRRRPAMRGAK